MYIFSHILDNQNEEIFSNKINLGFLFDESESSHDFIHRVLNIFDAFEQKKYDYTYDEMFQTLYVAFSEALVENHSTVVQIEPEMYYLEFSPDGNSVTEMV